MKVLEWSRPGFEFWFHDLQDVCPWANVSASGPCLLQALFTLFWRSTYDSGKEG